MEEQAMKRGLWVAIVISALSLLAILLLSSGFPTPAQQTASPPQPNLQGETLTAKLLKPVAFTLGQNSCALAKPPLTVQGTATGPLPGSVTITVHTLSQNSTNTAEFNATYEVTTSAGKLVIQNQGFTQAAPFDCYGQGTPGSGPAHQLHFGFKFVTQYEATLPNTSRHICGEATVDGLIGWSLSPLFKQHFSETLNSEKPCK
jgi:hypothetical protein